MENSQLGKSVYEKQQLTQSPFPVMNHKNVPGAGRVYGV
jgi:hypothetical protein